MSRRGPLTSFAVRVLGPSREAMREAEREWTLAEVPQSRGMDRDAVACAAARAWWRDTGQERHGPRRRSVVLLFAGEHYGQRVRFMRRVVVDERGSHVVRMHPDEAEMYVVAAEELAWAEEVAGGEEPSLSRKTVTSLPPGAGERAESGDRAEMKR